MSTKKGEILIVDDEEDLRRLLLRIISLEGYSVEEAGDLASAKQKLAASHFHLVLCDVKLPDGNGLEFLSEFKLKYPLTEIVMITAYGTIKDGVAAMKKGAFDYLTKGDDNERIIPLVERSVEKARQAQKLERLLQRESDKFGFEGIIGSEPVFLDVLNLAKKVAKTDTSVLLIGETGTGKEVFAKAIHHAGKRRKENFVAVNCAAFNKDLLTSELFGHLAGSFTGAVKNKKGLFEEANGGTLFLDEIGEMDLELQSKLLRVLETGSFIKVGGTRETKVDVRIVAATNRQLNRDAEQGRFRKDLFYRLNAFSIDLPPLRERPNDIQPLAEYFCDQLAIKLKMNPTPRMSPGFIRALQNHDWKGNIRELRNLIERALIIGEGSELTATDLPFDSKDKASGQSDSLRLKDLEKRHIRRVLSHTGGDKVKAAELLGIGLTTLYRKIDEYRIPT